MSATPLSAFGFEQGFSCQRQSSSTAKPAPPACKSGRSSRASPGLKLVSLPPEARKDAAAKQKLYGEVDVVILCLPDEAAKEAAHLIDAMDADGPV